MSLLIFAGHAIKIIIYILFIEEIVAEVTSCFKYFFISDRCYINAEKLVDWLKRNVVLHCTITTQNYCSIIKILKTVTWYVNIVCICQGVYSRELKNYI